MKDILSKNIRLLTYSFLDGANLYHKIALLNKETRASLPGAGLLDQLKELEFYRECKQLEPVNNQLKLEYALQIVDNINFIVNDSNRYQDQFKKICQIIQQKNDSSNIKVSVSLSAVKTNCQQSMMSLINSLNLPILAREDLNIRSDDFFRSPLPDEVQTIKKINIIRTDIKYDYAKFYNCEYLTLVDSPMYQHSGFQNLRQLRELNLSSLFVQSNYYTQPKRLFDKIIQNSYYTQGVTLEQGYINKIPSKQFTKLNLKIRNDGNLELKEICQMMQRSLAVHPSLRILLVSIQSDSFQLPQFSGPNKDQIFIQLEPNETFLFDSFVITIVSEEYNPKNQLPGFYSQYYFENIYQPRLYQIQFGKQNSNIQLVIQTSKILVFDDDKQETELLQINQTKIVQINPVISYKSKMFEQPNSKVRMLQDPFFQLEKTQQFALLRRELFETIELEDQVQSYFFDQTLTKHKPGKRQLYDCNYGNSCRNGKRITSEQYVQGWVIFLQNFEYHYCETCLQVEKYLGNTLQKKFPAQNYIYSDNERHLYIQKVSTVGRQLKNEQKTFQNILYNVQQYHHNYCDECFDLQGCDIDEPKLLIFDDIRTETFFSRCSIQMMRYNDLKFRNENYIPKNFEFIAMQEYKKSWQKYYHLQKLKEFNRFNEDIQLDVKMNALYDSKKSRGKPERHPYSLKLYELKPFLAYQSYPAQTKNRGLYLFQQLEQQTPQQNTVGQFFNEGGSGLFTQPQNQANSKIEQKRLFGQSELSEKVELFAQETQRQPISTQNNPLTSYPQPTVQSLFANQLVSESAFQDTSFYGPRTTLQLQSANVTAKPDEVNPTLKLSDSLQGDAISQLSNLPLANEEQKEAGDATTLVSLWPKPKSSATNDGFSIQ